MRQPDPKMDYLVQGPPSRKKGRLLPGSSQHVAHKLMGSIDKASSFQPPPPTSCAYPILLVLTHHRNPKLD